MGNKSNNLHNKKNSSYNKNSYNKNKLCNNNLFNKENKSYYTEIYNNEINLKNYSSIKIGYETKNIFFPETYQQLKTIIENLIEDIIFNKYNFIFTGGHTNILFHNKKKNIYIINFLNFNKIFIRNNILHSNSGVFSSFISAIGYIFGVKGYEFLHLLPGTIGGAVYMNARCYGNEIKNIINTVKSLKLNFKQIFTGKNIKNLNNSFTKNRYRQNISRQNIFEEKIYNNDLKKNNLKFGYKHSIFQENKEAIISIKLAFPTFIPDEISNYILNKFYNLLFNFKSTEKIQTNKTDTPEYLSLKNFYKLFSLKNINIILVKLLKDPFISPYLNKINRTLIYKKMEEIESDRVRKKHFLYPSLGSIFKNNYNYGIPMGKLIEDCGLKGTSINGAKISNIHGNIIINENNSSSTDVIELIKLIKNRINKKYGFTPEEEIIIL